MKKVLGLSALALAGVLAFTGCGKKDAGEATYGSYSYVAWGHTYGVQAKVTVKDGKVAKVELASDEKTGWTSLSAENPDQDWTAEKRQKWIDGEADFLKSFEGKTVDEVLAMEVTVNASGVPQTVAGIDAVAGATQSSGRVVKAVQDALAEYKAFH